MDTNGNKLDYQYIRFELFSNSYIYSFLRRNLHSKYDFNLEHISEEVVSKISPKINALAKLLAMDEIYLFDLLVYGKILKNRELGSVLLLSRSTPPPENGVFIQVDRLSSLIEIKQSLAKARELCGDLEKQNATYTKRIRASRLNQEKLCRYKLVEKHMISLSSDEKREDEYGRDFVTAAFERVAGDLLADYSGDNYHTEEKIVIKQTSHMYYEVIKMFSLPKYRDLSRFSV